MDEPRSSFTIDFGGVLHSRLVDAAEECGITKSELVRLAVDEFLTNGSYNNVVKRTVENKEQRKLGKKETVDRVISVYNDTYYQNVTPPRQFYPALYKTYNAATKGGLSLDEICDIVRYSPDESLISDGLRKGSKPSLPYILSAGMIPRILVVVHQKTNKQTKISEAEFQEYKFEMLDEYSPQVEYHLVDEFRDRLMMCKSRKEVEKVIKNYLWDAAY